MMATLLESVVMVESPLGVAGDSIATGAVRRHPIPARLCDGCRQRMRRLSGKG
jgi:hypothetical protein